MKKLLSILVLLLFTSLPGLCTQLPDPLISLVKETFPDASIRFDGVIELGDKTTYLPVLPLAYNNPDDPVKIVQTIPTGQFLYQKPDMVLFSNNLALLKIIKKPDEPPTVLSTPEMPLKVKLGLLPQDLVVPRGLVLSPDLKVILGDLKIPLKEKTDKEEDIAFYNRTEPVAKDNEVNISLIEKETERFDNLPELEFLKDKDIYAINSRNNKLYVLDSATARIIKTVSLPSVGAEMAKTPDNRYLLVCGMATNRIFIVDTVSNEYVKTLTVGQAPSSIVFSERNHRAYVANRFSGSISLLETRNMQVESEIPVPGYPDNLEISADNRFIFYNDVKTGTVYRLDLETLKVTELFRDKNISKLAKFRNNLFSLSRSENTLTVYNLKDNKITARVKTAEKPVDFEIISETGEIIVACAGTDELNIIDTESLDVINSIPLKSGGFAGDISIIKGEKGKITALISNYDAYEMVLYNVDTGKVLGYVPVGNILGSLVVVED